MGELDGWTTCPRCRGKLHREPNAVRCVGCGLVVYAKPAPAVCGLVVDGSGRVLLGRRAREPAKGRWDVLGGFMEEFEQPLETLRRELREETGLHVEPGAFVGAVSDRYGDGGNATLNLCWVVSAAGGEPRAGDDVAELGWFAPDGLPPADDLAFASTSELLRMWRSDRSR
jgi:ADP-ribose pyrophosphatase YjhB (NUDIX family)